jgi:hypothetical protein
MIYQAKSLFKLVEILPIHYKQIEKIGVLSEESIKNKSVVARAALGGMVFGPLGAVAGGISGLDKLSVRKILVINYWDVETKEIITLSFKVITKNYKEFVTRVKKEILKYK